MFSIPYVGEFVKPKGAKLDYEMITDAPKPIFIHFDPYSSISK
jgi:hypothetical protein